jgi:phage baseplate assembly protein V
MNRTAIEDLYRRARMAVGFGKITATRDDVGVLIAQAKHSELETRDNTAIVQHYGMYSRPHPGAEFVSASTGGDRATTIIIATGDQRYHIQLAEGEVCIKDDQGQKVHLTRAGIVIDGGGLPIKIQNAPTVTVDTPLLRCTGDIIDNYLATGRTMAGDRTIYDIHTHHVRNVQAGSATVISDIPDQLE